jgi:glycosyltransferase involved in cell wall biosynthesis
MLSGLKNAGVPFSWTPMVPGMNWGMGYQPAGKGACERDFDAFRQAAVPCDTLLVHLVPEYALRWRQLEPDKRLVLYTTWETDLLPRHWRFFLELADLVLVPSTWNKEVFDRANLRVPVEVLPHIAIQARMPAGPPPVGINSDDFVFLAIDSWTTRKRLRNLIGCFLDTFSARDPVTLVVKTDARSYERSSALPWNTSTAAEVRALRRRHRDPARISLLTGILPQDDILRLHDRADCFVSLSSAEGWGMGPFDAAAFGTPVISTGFGGALDYLTEDNAYLVRCRMVPVENERGRPSFMPDQMWAEPDSIHAAQLMRHVVANREEAAERGKRLQSAVRERFGEAVVTERLMRLVGGEPGGRETAAP